MSALQLQKPVQIHPIEYMADLYATLDVMVEKYKGHVRVVETTKESICDQPFMVFCLSKHLLSSSLNISRMLPKRLVPTKIASKGSGGR